MSEERAALLVMDVQQEIVERFGDRAILKRLGQAIAAARAARMLVIYVKVEFRPGYPEVSPRNAAFSGIAASGGFSPTSLVHPAIAPGPADVQVIKKRVSAFAGSDLELLLRAGDIGTLVLAGIATSGVVLSTLRAAADLDYRLVVLRDCCADSDDEVHRVLLDKVFPRQAEVLDSQTWAGRLKTGP